MHFGLTLAAVLIATSAVHAATAPMAASLLHEGSSSAWFQRTDARGYHHCHNTPRRIRCHKSEWLPGL